MINKEQEFSFEEIPISDKVKWEQSIAHFKCSFYCTWEYNNVIQKAYDSKIFLTIIRSQSGIPVCIFIWMNRNNSVKMQYQDIQSPYGFGGLSINGSLSLEIVNTLREYCLAKNIVTAYLQIHPCIQNIPGQKYFTCRTGYLVDLTLSAEAIQGILSKNMRRDIHFLESEWGQLVSSDKNLIASHAPELFKSSIEQKNASKIYYSLASMVSDFISLDNTFALGIVDANELKSFLIIGMYNGYSEYFLSASKKGCESLSKLLIWKSIEALKLSNHTKLYLGGGIYEGDSLQQFKKRFGSDRIYLYSLKLISDENIYHARCNMAENLRINFFPPYY